MSGDIRISNLPKCLQDVAEGQLLELMLFCRAHFSIAKGYILKLTDSQISCKLNKK